MRMSISLCVNNKCWEVPAAIPLFWDLPGTYRKIRDLENGFITYSIGTKSLTIMLPIVIMPPAPRPQNALAMIRLVMEFAKAHHSVASRNMVMVAT